MEINKAILKTKQQLTANIYRFEFTTQDKFIFKPGQFVSFKVSDMNNGKPTSTWRSYSLCNIPDNRNSFELAVKLIPHGTGSQFLTKLSPGDEVIFKGPLGQFVLNDSEPNQIFIATGIGITPFVPMIDQALNLGLNTELHFGNKTEKDIVFDEIFNKYERQYPQIFKYIKYISKNNSTIYKKGRITNHIVPDLIRLNTMYYICGSKEMIQDVRHILLDQGTNTTKIHKEAFY